MNSPASCPIHGRVFWVPTSPLLAQAVRGGTHLTAEVCLVDVELDARTNGGTLEYYIFDRAFCEQFADLELADAGQQSQKAQLKDRSREDKILNDRLLIQQIFAKTSKVCPHCLQALCVRR